MLMHVVNSDCAPILSMPSTSAFLRRRDSFDVESHQQQPLISPVQESHNLGTAVSTSSASRRCRCSSNHSVFGSWQYLVAMCTLSVVICYADRSNISTALLAMALEFDWDKAHQGVVLSSFFAGYALTQVVGGGLADKYGGKLVLAGGVALWSAFTAITPGAAAAGTTALLVTRVLLGVGEGVAFPAIHSLIPRHVPLPWQSTVVGVVTAAAYAGTALAFGLSPAIISNLGWPSVFYLFGAAALLWLPLWLPAVMQSSSQSKRRTSDDSTQVHYFVDAAPVLGPARPADAALAGSHMPGRGFGELMKRREVWAICAAQYCQSWGMYGLINWLPTFFSDHYHVELSDMASYTLLPYLVQGAVGMLAGMLADRLILTGWGVKPTRVLLQVVGMLGPAVCLLLAVTPLVGASQPGLASVLITMGLGLSALTLGGVSASHLDIAPSNAGIIFGAGNTAATVAGLLSVPVTGLVLQGTGSWSLIFGIIAVHYVVGAALWVAWVGDKRLPEDMPCGGDVSTQPSSNSFM